MTEAPSCPVRPTRLPTRFSARLLVSAGAAVAVLLTGVAAAQDDTAPESSAPPSDAAPAADAAPTFGTPVATLDWATVFGDDLPDGVTREQIDGRPAIKVVIPPEGGTVALGEIAPTFTKDVWLVSGELKAEGVAAAGFVEMNNHFSKAPQPFFTRTLSPAPGDPAAATWNGMEQIAGTTGWRPLNLPFAANVGEMAGQLGGIEKLSFNLTLPQGGTVWISELTVSELDEAETNRFYSQAMQTSGLGRSTTIAGFTMPLGAWIGTGVGLLSAAIGSVVGLIGFRRQRGEAAAEADERRMASLDL